MPSDDLLKVADEALFNTTGNRLTDVQRLILRESLAGKGYESMEGYSPQHIKNEGKALWDLLSKALGEKVSKTSFKGALEKRWTLGELVPNPPQLSIYSPKSWVGRKAILDQYLPELQGQTRSLWITGISGIGKTILGECLAKKAWDSDPSFQWIHLEILEGQSPDFATGAADLLTKMGEPELDLQERNDPKRLTERLIRKLQANRYWIQWNSLERLLSSEQSTETAAFVDGYWVTFLQRCLTAQNFASRMVLTAQALPSALAEFEDRYPNVWQVITLQGLSANEQANEHLELFRKNGVTVDEGSAVQLIRIGQIYEGHPLVLRVIAGDILSEPFCGDLANYWQRYGHEFEQVARELQSEQVNPALYNHALQTQVRRRVELSLKRLPQDAFDLLCRSSVYRRPVPEKFWLAMIGDHTPQQQQQAYLILGDRTLVEREGIHQNQFLIHLHNLIRDVAYDLLKSDTPTLHQAERQAAELWLTAYKPTPDAPKVETVRGYLEAFEHYYEIKDWEAAKEIAWTRLDTPIQADLVWQLGTWGYFKEQILFLEKLLVVSKAIDPKMIGRILDNMGNAYEVLGQYQQSIEFHQQHLTIAREIGDHQGELSATFGLGHVHNCLGQYKRAIEFFKQMREIVHNISDWPSESSAMLYEIAAMYLLGCAYHRVGDYGQANDIYQQFLTMDIKIDNHQVQYSAMDSLGNADSNLGLYEKWIESSQGILTFFQTFGFRMSEGVAYFSIGSALLGGKQYSESFTHNQKALVISREVGDRNLEAKTLKNLAELHKALGDIEVARQHCQHALELATELGIPIAAECEALMESLAQETEEAKVVQEKIS
jgi:tetratricopeptide (TPR) repeat protein